MDYVRAFWPYVARAIAADPAGLGLSTVLPRGEERIELNAAAMREAYCADPAVAGSAADKRRRGSVLSALALMQQVLGAATAAWAADLTALPRRCPLDYLVDARHFVSLRMLLPRRGEQADRVGGNAPTLVMGGTATALTMCWNLLDQLPRAWRELTGTALDAGSAEQVWRDTRELVFRIGGGSLTAFVASRCLLLAQADAMLWDGAQDLGLVRRGERLAWTVSSALAARHRALVEDLEAAQAGHYVGCAALFARTAPLPLATAWADAVDEDRDQPVFAELLRWVTAVARQHYFPTLDAA